MTTQCKRLWRRVILAMGAVIVLGLVAAWLWVSLMIGADVRAISTAATQSYEGERVEALLQCVADSDRSLRDRNRAIWALGQLGDRRALEPLKKRYTGEPCDHSTRLCQHELEKAIELLESGVNFTAIVWRGSLESPSADNREI